MTVFRWRWLAVFFAGFILWFLAAVLGRGVMSAFTDNPTALTGMDLALQGIIRLAVWIPGLYLILRFVVGKRFSDMGFALDAGWKPEAALGVVVGIIKPLLQFLILIPLTGGAAREDVAASRALFGNDVVDLIGVIFLSWTLAAVGEETFFRGHIIYSLRGLFGTSRGATFAAAAVSVVFFALTHAYQGVIGILDVGISGAIFTLLYLRRGSLVAPIIAHGLNDTLLFIGLYLFF